MSFRKTSGRGVFVQPTGMPDLSGFHKAAREVSNIGDLAMSVGTDMRRREYNNYLRDAEIAGKTSGVVLDEEGNLKPLVNFDYDKADDLFSENDRENVRKAYKSAAVNAYVASADVDIRSQAEQAFINNPMNPNAIEGEYQGVINALGELDPDIAGPLSLSAKQHFTVARNRAKASQQKQAVNDQVSSLEKEYKNKVRDVAILNANGDITDPEQRSMIKKATDVHMERFSQIRDNLKTLGVSDASLDKLREDSNTLIYSEMARFQLEKAITDGGPVKVKEMVYQLSSEADKRDDINATAFRAFISNVGDSLISIDASEKQAERDYKTAIYNDFLKGFALKEIDLAEEFGNPESNVFLLDGGQILNLANYAQEGTTQAQKDAQDAAKDVYDNNFSILEQYDLEEANLVDINGAFGKIREEFLNGRLGPTGPKMLLEAQAKREEAENFLLAKNSRIYASALDIELGSSSSFAQDPSYYSSESFISNLEDKRVIGKGGYWANRSSYVSAVERYEGFYDKKIQTVALANQAEKKLMNRITPTATETNALISEKGFNKIILNDQVRDLDLLSEDEEVLSASIDAVVAFSVISKGLIHPQAKQIIEQAPYTVENANRALRIVSQLSSAMRQQFPNEPEHEVQSRFLVSLEDESVTFLRTLGVFGPERTVEAYAAASSANRNASKLQGKDVLGGKTIDDIFEETLPKALEGANFFKFFNPRITNADNQMLTQMARDGGVNDVEALVINNPAIKEAIRNIFVGKLLINPDANRVEAMRDTLREIGKRVGPQENLKTGELELVQAPILREAQSTVGATGITLTMDDLVSEVKNQFLKGDNLLNAQIAKDMALVGTGKFGTAGPQGFVPTLSFIPNEVFGGRQTYRVYLNDSYGKSIPINNAFRYDFKKSLAYGVEGQQSTYTRALGALNNNRVIRFFSGYGLMDESLLNSAFRAYQRTGDDRSLNGLVTLFNNTFTSVNPMSDAPLTENEIKDFGMMINTLGILGWY